MQHEDDYMSQEQYVLELPEELGVLAESDRSFGFDLVFDQSGLRGRLDFWDPRAVADEYHFRVLTLPLVTESYTSANNDVFYKNADIGQLILVYRKDEVPQLLSDHELYRAICMHRMAYNAFPTADVSPHGLTPPSLWAPLQLYPQLPSRPKWAKCVPVGAPTDFDEEAQTRTRARGEE